MPPKREAGATASPTPIKMLKINTVPMEAGPMNLTESTYSPFLHTEQDFEDLEEEASEGIRTDTISLLMKIEQLQAQLKYERRCRILAERELRQMKDIEELQQKEELDFAEAKLQSIDARKAMVSRLSLVGGTTLEVRVRWMLRTTLSNELASQLNWAGKMAKVEAKQKRAFKDTNLCKIIYDSLKRQMGMEASEYEFAAVVKKWLRYAPDRVGGKGRSESCQTEEEA
ncbi:uncharacterized protein LOC130922003 isoform X7 [Corythoichthys intestinalis]|uniref:uncharacterized protein LOC130922003 isoform X7 n=1 Tax=Corythoichthys intestinalis TaxID=161448 RepID=UPI0025A4FD9E|nr:uncharacterized protein LOC130922003 isoform X7 [Corythoichthys intestinalis]